MGTFDADGNIAGTISFERVLNDNGGVEERFILISPNTVISQLQNQLPGNPSLLADFDSSSIQFTQQATPVPFEVSPTLGLLVVGSLFAGSRWRKRRNNSVK